MESKKRETTSKRNMLIKRHLRKPISRQITSKRTLMNRRALLSKRATVNKKDLKRAKIVKNLLKEDSKDNSFSDEIDEEDSFSDEDDDSSSVSSSLDEIQMDFEASAISEGDYHGIRRLLQQLLLKAPVNLSDITSDIINQSEIGSVIKACNDDDSSDDNDVVYGVTTALINKKEYNKQLFDFLIERCDKIENQKFSRKFQTILTDPTHNMGVVFHERFLNIPVDIGPPLLNCLMNEIYTGRKDKVLPTHLLLISRSHSTPCLTSKKKRKESSSQELNFDFPEVEYFKKEALLEFSYPVGTDQDTVISGKWSYDDETLAPHRSVIILTTDSFCEAIRKLNLDFQTNL